MYWAIKIKEKEREEPPEEAVMRQFRSILRSMSIFLTGLCCCKSKVCFLTSQLERPDLGFDPEDVFHQSYAEACKLIEEILAVPPMGEKFTAAVGGLHSLANILDRLFQSWATSTDDGQKFSQLREDSDTFVKSFGTEALRKLLAHAGFQRQALVADGFGQRSGFTIYIYMQIDII